MNTVNNSFIFKTLEIQFTPVFFLFDPSLRPMIQIASHFYSSLFSVVCVLPELKQPKYWKEFALIANFLAKGIEFEVIQNTLLFKQQYLTPIASSSFSHFLFESSFGTFDLSNIHDPCFDGSQFVFFARHDYFNIPYQVKILDPFHQRDPFIAYCLLPS